MRWSGERWDVDDFLPGSNADLDMLSVSDGWLVGSSGMIQHWDGHSWSFVDSPSYADLARVTMVAPDDGWSVGTGDGEGQVLRWDGRGWSIAARFEGVTLSSLSVVSPTSVWVGGSDVARRADAAVVLHWDGREWQQTALAGDYEVVDLAMVSDRAGWAIGDSVHRWDGSSWRTVAAAEPGAAIEMLSDSDGWLAGESLQRWDGSTWTTVVRSGVPDAPLALDLLGANDGWGVGYGGTTWHWDGAAWSAQAPETAGALTAIDGDSQQAWAVGSPGEIWRYRDRQWHRLDSPTDEWLHGAAVVSADDVWAVGSHGVTIHWDGDRWALAAAPDPLGPELVDVSFASPQSGWAISLDAREGSGAIWRWDDGAWTETYRSERGYLLSIEMVSETEGWAAGAELLRWDGDNWAPFPDPRPSPAGYALVAVVSSNDVWLASYDYGLYQWDGSAWHSYERFGRVTALAMESPDCGWAATSDPTAMWRWDGTAWTEEHRWANSELDIWSVVADGDLAWAVGIDRQVSLGAIFGLHGSTWLPELAPLGGTTLTSVSMTARSDGWAVGTGGSQDAGPGPKPGVMLHWDGSTWRQWQWLTPAAEVVQMLSPTRGPPSSAGTATAGRHPTCAPTRVSSTSRW